MTDQYFDLAQPSHFWVERRFEVLQRLAGRWLHPGVSCLEIGCGSGVLQEQIESRLGFPVDGCDLNLTALSLNRSRQGALLHYDIHERRPEFRERYDLVLMFDALEHIRDDIGFLQAAAFHLKKGGHLVLNVPARRELFSQYDVVNGHERRYHQADLKSVVRAAGLEVHAATYWGLPLYPVLFARKFAVRFLAPAAAYQRGFQPPGRFANRLLRLLSRFEPLPQSVMGTSILLDAILLE